MKVTSLDVSNLLSFGEFHLDFDDRLTVLVGPNGAGKTNIVRVLDLVAKLVVGTGSGDLTGNLRLALGKQHLDKATEVCSDSTAPTARR